jgi:hypothetical protein
LYAASFSWSYCLPFHATRFHLRHPCIGIGGPHPFQSQN